MELPDNLVFNPSNSILSCVNSRSDFVYDFIKHGSKNELSNTIL